MMKTGTDWRKASRHYSRGRFNSLSVKLVKDGSINLGSEWSYKQPLGRHMSQLSIIHTSAWVLHWYWLVIFHDFFWGFHIFLLAWSLLMLAYHESTMFRWVHMVKPSYSVIQVKDDHLAMCKACMVSLFLVKIVKF